jgi:ATP-dependent exoDNAse (exonuclease V) beta subunit
MKPFPTLSPSAIADFEGCPKRWHETKILKRYKFEVTEQITYGNEVHKNLEEYTKFKTPLPEHLEYIAPVIDKCREEYVLCAELEIAINENWEPVGYWDKTAMLRGKIDFVAVSKKEALIIDWKTGKRKPDPFQLYVYGAMLFQILGVEKVAAGFAWLKTKERDIYSVSSQNFQELRTDITERIARMKDAYERQEFEARTSMLCCWCPALPDCEAAVYYRENKDKIRRGR